MAEATAHLPAHRPTEDHELPQGRKNWDKPPHQEDGPEAPKPQPTPEAAGAGRTSTEKKPQQVSAPKSQREVDEPDPTGETYPDDPPRPQQIDGPEGPKPTDGTELNDAVASQVPGEPGKGGPVSVKAKKPVKAAPAKAAPSSESAKSEAKES